MRAKTRLLGLILVLAAPAGATEPQLSADQQAACGALLCLAGGDGVVACAPYLARFFAIPKVGERRSFLNQCPGSGLSGAVIGELARFGENCQPSKLVNFLNERMCRERSDQESTCRAPDANGWRGFCGNFYAELTNEAPPKLVQRCRNERDDTGAFARVCHHWWVENDYKAGGWCKDKDASCKENDAATEAESLAHNAIKRAGNR